MAERMRPKKPKPAKTKAKAKAKRAGKSSGAEGQEYRAIDPTSNVTDATMRDYFNQARAKKLAHDKIMKEAKAANAEYRAVLKEAKANGVDPKWITSVLEFQKREPEDVNREIRGINRVAKVAKYPLEGGVQLGLFPDGQTVADKIEREAGHGKKKGAKANGDGGEVEAPSREKAFEQGAEAGKTGKSAKLNPWKKGTLAHVAWLEGWQSEQAKIAERMGGLAEAGEDSEPKTVN